jgi:putative transposase
MLIHRANVYRLAPTSEQAVAFTQWVGACRAVYNLALEQRRDWSRPGRKFTYLSQQAELTALRAEIDWMRAVPVHALQMSIRALDTAFQRFFMGLPDYPKPRKKFINNKFTLPELPVAIHTSRQSCSKAGKARRFALVWESSGESRSKYSYFGLIR